MNNRAQSIGIVHFFASLVVGAIVIWVVNLLADPILLRAGEASTNPEASQATEWITLAVNYLPVFFLVIAFFGLTAWSVATRRVGV